MSGQSLTTSGGISLSNTESFIDGARTITANGGITGPGTITADSGLLDIFATISND
jgi:hypothetical protein